MRQIFGEKEMFEVIKKLAKEIVDKENLDKLVLIGIKRRGVPIAYRISEEIKKINGREVPVGELDITFYRDDLQLINETPVVRGSNIKFDIKDKVVILVDDVLYTGRTVRAAMDEILEWGRPKKIKLCVLIDRGHRELPICADYVGKKVDTTLDEIVEVKVKEYDGENKVIIVKKGEI